MSPTNPPKDNKLVHDLFEASKPSKSSKKNNLIKGSDYVPRNAPEMTIRSWKMNEFMYHRYPCPFPTLARGLFTTEVNKGRTSSDAKKEYRIVIRGYDKFFNIGEVKWTNWDSLRAHTKGPYTLSLKSNGCIIFIAALTTTKLLVTSKHSLGPVSGAARSHSQVGEEWLHKHLEKVGKTPEQLAETLRQNNWTAIAELCDDDFEEHVLPYPPEKTGLHLHGINENTGVFRTQPTNVVDEFADEWGFIKTKTKELTSIEKVRNFTSEIGKTGKWEGEAIEGFVIRTQAIHPPAGEETPPYEPGSSFFFKVKFDEPYMMYRDWREITKTLLSTKGQLSDVRLPKKKMERPETKLYVKWITKEIKENRAQFQDFRKGKGIIATRERFLKWMETGQANEVTVDADADASRVTFAKTIILPIGVPGVGKTTISVALENLFGFKHTQSDDVKSKKNRGPQFTKNVKALLKNHDVVIADKNNHLKQHRIDLKNAAPCNDQSTRLLALNWALEGPSATIHKICSDRVCGRGGNHQTLQADVHGKSHEEVIWRFIKEREELEEGEVHEVIEMDINEDIEHALDRAVDGCVRILGLEKPDQEKVALALTAARSYESTKKNDGRGQVKKNDGRGQEKKKNAEPRYYGFVPDINLLELLDPVFSAGGDADIADGKKFLTRLKENNRITKQPHITIVHKKSLDPKSPESQRAEQLWKRCSELCLSPTPSTFRFRLGSVVWNARVMAVTVNEVAPVDGDDEAGKSFVDKLPQGVKEKLHITVGTAAQDIPPVEARELVEGESNAKSLQLTNESKVGPIRGLFS